MSISPVSEQFASESEISLKDYLNIIRKRKAVFIQVLVMGLTVGIAVTALSKPVYQTRAKLLVRAGSPQVNIVDTKNPISALLAAMNPDSMATQMQVLQSEPFLEEARRRARVRPKAGVMQPSARVEALEESNVIRITVEGGDPQEIARFANAMVDLHLEQTDQLATTGLIQTINHVRKERDRAARDLASAERKLVQFKTRNKLAEMQAQQTADATEYVDLQAKVGETQRNIVATRAQIAELRAQLEKEPTDLVYQTTKENPVADTLRESLSKLKLDRVDLLREYKPTSARVKALDEQIAAAQEQLKAEPEEITIETHMPNPIRQPLQTRLADLEAVLQGHQAAYNAAQSEFEVKKHLVDSLLPWEVELARLTREQELAQTAYVNLTEQFRDLEIRRNADMRMAREVERAAVPERPVLPRPALNITLSAVLALLLATGMAFLQEYLDDRVGSPEDLERVCSLPTIGHVPMMALDQSRLVSGLPANSHVAESYRALRSSIGFAGIDAPIRRLQVTSPSKGEGKSITSANLAIAMAMDGKKVILVDADLRRPAQHRLLNVSSSPGLSEVLVGLKSVAEAIQPTDVENLYVLCAGPIPPNPAELLGTSAFDRVLQQLDDIADVIIVDTPPCIPVTDPLIVAARMDGVVLVLHAGQTRKGAVRHAVEMLSRARARIVGTLFNRVQARRGGYYYYYHYYYYGDHYYADSSHKGDGHRRDGKGRRRELAGGHGDTVSAVSRVLKDDEDV